MKLFSIILTFACCSNIIEKVKARYLLIKIQDGMNHNGGYHNQGTNPDDPLSKIISDVGQLVPTDMQSRRRLRKIGKGLGWGVMMCFHGSNIVHLRNGGQKTISDVTVGDSVLAVDEKGTLQFSQVIMQLHKDPEVETEFQVITTKEGRNMTLTSTHLIYRANNDTPNIISKDFVTSTPTFAMKILKGDFIFILEANKRMIKDEVVSNDVVIRKGIYSPVTSHGTIIVNDIAASCYANYNHQLTHLVFAPFRWFEDANNFLASMKSTENHIYSEIEHEYTSLHWYAEACLSIVNNLLPNYQHDQFLK